MKRYIFFLLILASFYCGKEEYCTGATYVLKQNVLYTAKTSGWVSATINGCAGVYIWVNCWKAASSNDRNAHISTYVVKGDKWRVSSQCTDIGITVKFEENCN